MSKISVNNAWFYSFHGCLSEETIVGGEYLVRAGEFQIFDGETKFPRIIILKFPSYERALEWYNSEEYKPIKQIRLDNAEGTNIIIKGL